MSGVRSSEAWLKLETLPSRKLAQDWENVSVPEGAAVLAKLKEPTLLPPLFSVFW